MADLLQRADSRSRVAPVASHRRPWSRIGFCRRPLGDGVISAPDPLAPLFANLRAAGRTALVPYLTAGYPAPDRTLPLMHAYARAGADIIELGVPFSDPVADGPTI